MRAMTLLRWFISQTVRNACAARKHHRRLLEAQKDLLSAEAIGAMRLKLDELSAAIATGQAGGMKLKIAELRAAAGLNLIPYPYPVARELVDILVVALAVALTIRTFFLQPFKIPSGSMQPTLFGVNTVPDFTDAMLRLEQAAEVQANGGGLRPRFVFRIQNEFARQVESEKALVIPHGWDRIKQWFDGETYVHFVAPANGRVEAVRPPWPAAIFSLYQRIKFAGQWHTLWFPPDYGDDDLRHRAGLLYGHDYHQGDDIIRLRVGTGDHLLVDRLSYNFYPPERGDIAVFATTGTELHEPDEDFIKRLTVLPGERAQIGDDRHLVINGHRLDATTPHFEKVFGFNPGQPPQVDQYSGYLNGVLSREYIRGPNIAPLFPDADSVYTNGPDSYLFMGDNTCNSYDSRSWGQVPTENVIGKSFFVYWPLSSRFGLNHD
jgi:signal peptidase I